MFRLKICFESFLSYPVYLPFLLFAPSAVYVIAVSVLGLLASLFSLADKCRVVPLYFAKVSWLYLRVLDR